MNPRIILSKADVASLAGHRRSNVDYREKTKGPLPPPDCIGLGSQRPYWYADNPAILAFIEAWKKDTKRVRAVT